MTVSQLRTLPVSVLLSAALCACATYQQCGFRGCAGDAAITAAVEAEITNHPDFGPLANFTVKTLAGVVYISGKVDTDLQKQAMQEALAAVPNVQRIVDSTYTNNTAL